MFALGQKQTSDGRPLMSALQLISIVGRYGTLDKEFTALMDQSVAAYNKAKR